MAGTAGRLAPGIRFDDWLVETKLQALVRASFRLGIHPNVLTLAGLLAGAAVPVLHYAGRPVLVALALIVRQLLDCLDGAVARFSRKTSTLGAVLDSISDGVLFLALLWLLAARFESRPLTAALLAGSAFAGLFAAHVFFCSWSSVIDHAVKSYEVHAWYRRAYAFLVANSLLFVAAAAALYFIGTG